jgi:seryl-tRNA synthetase
MDLHSRQPNEAERVDIRKFRDDLKRREEELDEYNDEYFQLLKAVPNIPADDVPVGASEAENVVAKEWGEKPLFEFQPRTHWEIAEHWDLIDKARAARVAGARFAYIKGDLVKLQFAIIQFVIETLTSEDILKKIAQDFQLEGISTKPFIPILPPLMIKTSVYEDMDRLEPRDDRYQIAGEELWLQGSAEHTLGSMYLNEILDVAGMPIRYLGYATSFRKEAGTYGKDTEGIIRMHQFDKLEMESFSLPEHALDEHLFMIAIQEYLMQQLKVPYRVLQKCTADIGKPNARGIDIEAWLPGAGMYKETHTADYMTDYQARRLNTRVKRLPKDAEKKLLEEKFSGAYNTQDVRIELVHTNDATAFALGRTLAAIMENYQTIEGKIKVPEVLQSYMRGQTSL